MMQDELPQEPQAVRRGGSKHGLRCPTSPLAMATKRWGLLLLCDLSWAPFVLAGTV